MARNRDPFMSALRRLRARAVGAAFQPGRPIVILDEAQALRLSTTPVREALSWLGGEGLVERGAAGGYVGLRAEPSLVAARYRMRLRCLLAAVEETPPGLASLFTTRPGDVLDEIVAASSDPILTAVYRRMQDQLAPLVALEPSILGPDKADLEEIAAARSDAAKLKDALIRHHRLRIDAAPLLAAALERRGAEPEPM